MAIGNPQLAIHRAYTLIEMLTTVAALVIVLGLMVALARHVRARSSEALTHDLLARLDRMMAQYTELHPPLARVPRLIPDGAGGRGETALQSAAMENNKALVRICRERGPATAFAGLPLSIYDDRTLRDAWGTPIVYLPPEAHQPGMEPRRRHIFLSAGPDRRFGTLLDNLYSSEGAWAGPLDIANDSDRKDVP